MRHLTYNVWRYTYWIWVAFKVAIVALLIVLAYYLVDQMVDEDFVSALGVMDLLTAGLAAQRLLRNEVICTTALAYNNYTLANLRTSVYTYAAEKNLYAYEDNIEELARVQEWNSYFCSSWISWLGTVRDVSEDGWNGFAIVNGSDNLIDDDTDTYWVPNVNSQSPSMTDVSLTFVLPMVDVDYTRDVTAYWQISQIRLIWDFEPGTNRYGESDAIQFDFYTKLNDSDEFTLADADANSYYGSVTNVSNDIQYINTQWNESKHIQITFYAVNWWSDSFALKQVQFYGNVPSDKISCPYVTFYYWDFEASQIPDAECPAITPIHGIMYRGFVRDWLNHQLWNEHVLFIRAVRNICLSPFYILLFAVVILFGANLLGFALE